MAEINKEDVNRAGYVENAQDVFGGKYNIDPRDGEDVYIEYNGADGNTRFFLAFSEEGGIVSQHTDVSEIEFFRVPNDTLYSLADFGYEVIYQTMFEHFELQFDDERRKHLIVIAGVGAETGEYQLP